MTLTEACEHIMEKCPNQYAKSYAMAWLDGSVEARAKAYGVLLIDAKKSQALYLLSNIEHWRGDTAKAVRKALKEI